MDNVHIVNNQVELEKLASELVGVEVLGIDTEVYMPNHYTNHLLTLQISDGEKVWVVNYINTKDITLLQTVFADENTLKIFQNASFDIKILHENGIPEINNIFDTMLAEKLLTAGLISEANLGALATKYTSVDVVKNVQELNFENVYETGQITTPQLEYAAKDALVLPQIYRKQTELILAQELEKVLRLEIDLLPVVIKMEEKGLYVDSGSWSNLITKLEEKRDKINAEIQKIVIPYYESSNIGMFGGESEVINLNSPKQVLELFNEKLNIDIKSTREYEIAKIDHEVARKLLEYRELEKLVKAFGRNLLEKVNPKTNRIHSSFKQLGADTGRFSSQDPNFQQIPTGGAGKDIRSYFKPQDGYDFIIADYSQQELRIVAHYSQDESLLRAFSKGVDLHKFTASLVFGVDIERVTSEQRSAAKTLNFGIIYGMGSRALAQNLNISLDEANILLDKYNNAFKSVRQFLDKMGREAIAKGYTTTLFGRKRFYSVPREKTEDFARQLAGIRRAAMNHPFQGSGADMIKLSLIAINKRLENENLNACIVNTIHDEIIVESIKSDSQKVSAIVEEEMVKASQNLMPDILASVDAKIAKNWGEEG